MSSIVNNLNDAQREAVITTEGPVMVMAGAGSGKTRVLTRRIAYLVEELGIPPYQILAVTFTNKAAREMKERVSKLVSTNTNAMWVSTFHSFGARFLRMEIGSLPGYQKNFTIIDSDDSLKIIKEYVKEYGLYFSAQEHQNIISDLKNGNGFPKLDSREMQEVQQIYAYYQEHLLKNNLLDFDDLLCLTLKILEENLPILEKYQTKFQYIMIDEFQDTNHVQYQLVRLLGAGHHNVFIVGDQDQSIYSFRGAKVENIEQFQRDYPKTKVILLEQNYRSTKHILNLANKVISTNQGRIKKNLFTNEPDGHKAIYYQADTSYGEVVFVVQEIKNLIRQGYDYRDMAIIYRLNSLSRVFEDEFVRHKIPYTIYGGIPFFGRKEVKDIFAYLRLALLQDDFSLQRIINVPRRKIGESSIQKIADYALEKKRKMFDVLEEVPLSPSIRQTLTQFKRFMLEVKDSIQTLSLVELMKKIIEESGYLAMLEAANEEDRIDNIKELYSIMRDTEEFYEGDNQIKLEQFLSDLALKTDTDTSEEETNIVKLMSYHQAKGLEYKVVFLVAFEADIFPSPRAYSAEEKEEEVRICYVGITRARERLYISGASSRRMFGKDNMASPSPFLRYLDRESLEMKGQYVSEQRASFSTTPAVNKVESTGYHVGDKIMHKIYGIGMVVSTTKDQITVAFKQEYGIKTLIASHPSITRYVKEETSSF